MNTSFQLMSSADAPIHSADAAASLSIDDANFDGVKHHDVNQIDPQNRMITYAIAGVASVGVILGLSAMLVEMSVIAYLAFAFPLVTAPCIVVQRQKIQWLPTFRDEHNKLRMQVNDFAMLNNRLSNENGRLERQVARMQALEDRFEHVVKRESKDVNRTRELVRENGRILREMKKLQAAKDLQLLFSIILKSDKDEDNIISEEDMNRFVVRVKAIYGKNHKIFNEANIRNAFKASMTKTNYSLINITASMMEEQQKSEEQAESREPVYETLQKVPSRHLDQPKELEITKIPSDRSRTIERVPTKDLEVTKIPSDIEETDDVEMGIEYAEDTDAVPTVMSTGLVLSNEGSIREQVPSSLYCGNPENPSELFIQAVDSDMLLNGLLSSNSKEYDVASTAPSTAPSMNTDDCVKFDHKIV